MKEIFLVEDDDGIRELISYLLETENFSVTAFPDARNFQRTIKSKHPDLILLDVMLPDGNGVEICKDLGEDGDTREIPVVLMSAHADAGISEDDHAKDFIAKPFDINDFLNRIKRQLV